MRTQALRFGLDFRLPAAGRIRIALFQIGKTHERQPAAD
jgi:hypothetical protein